jgi:hypothetical protein
MDQLANLGREPCRVGAWPCSGRGRGRWRLRPRRPRPGQRSSRSLPPARRRPQPRSPRMPSSHWNAQIRDWFLDRTGNPPPSNRPLERTVADHWGGCQGRHTPLLGSGRLRLLSLLPYRSSSNLPIIFKFKKIFTSLLCSEESSELGIFH